MADYIPRVKDAQSRVDPGPLRFDEEVTFRVVAVLDEHTLQLQNGLVVQLLGIRVPPERREAAIHYLRKFVLGKPVHLRFDQPPEEKNAPMPAYLYLTNRLFVNRKMIEMGLADADRSISHRYRERFLAAEERRKEATMGFQQEQSRGVFRH